MILTILGILLIIFSILDGLKYHWVADKIRSIKSAKGQSRKFINVALGKDIVFLIYMWFKPDTYLILMTLIGFIFALEMFWMIYLFYPYRTKNLRNFKRPNIFKYFINSLTPNIKRKHL